MVNLSIDTLKVQMDNLKENIEAMDKRNTAGHEEIKAMFKEAMSTKADISVEKQVADLQQTIRWVVYLVFTAVIGAIMSMILK